MFRSSTFAITLALVGCASSPAMPAQEPTTTPAPDVSTPAQHGASEVPVSDAGPYKDVAAFCEFWSQKPNEHETASPCTPSWKEDIEIVGTAGPYRSARALSLSKGNTALMVETSVGLFYVADLQLDASWYGEEVDTKVTLETFEAGGKTFLQINTNSKSRAGLTVTNTRGVIYCNTNGSCKNFHHQIDESGDGYSAKQLFTITREGPTVTVATADGAAATMFEDTVGTHDLLALP